MPGPGAPEEEMIEGCRKASIYDFISKQPDGLDMMEQPPHPPFGHLLRKLYG